MNARSSGKIGDGVSKYGSAPSGSIVVAPSLAKKVAIWFWASYANVSPGPRMFVRNVCGLELVPKSGFVRSFRKIVVRLSRCPAWITRVAVGFGTVLSPRANWIDDGHRDVRRPALGVPRLLGPLGVVQEVLDRLGAVDGVDHDRLALERHVLVEVDPVDRRGVVEAACQQRQPDEAAEARREACDLDDRAAGDVRHAGMDRRLETEQLDAVDAAERLAGVVDARRAQVGRAVPVDVDTALQHVRQLHEVDHRLAQAVTVRDDRAVRRVDALGGVDRAVVILVDPAAARRASSASAAPGG